MAKCDLSIELDEPDRVYGGGDKITGTVHVVVDANVKCKGLDVQTNWRTHGRGNIASGTRDSITLFSGEWTAGQNPSYRFELVVPDWPPSYHGGYINIDHCVHVRAKIPWAFDPKASRDYVMRPNRPMDSDAIPAQSTEVSGCVGYVVAAVFIGFLVFFCGGMAAAFAANPIIPIVGSVIVLPIFGFIAARYYLPKFLLGNVECELSTPIVSPGGVIEARLAFQPRRGSAINGITAALVGSEVCVSGSGSNRTTHTNKFFDESQLLQEATRLQAGSRQEFDLKFQVPSDVPYSFDLSDNDLRWQVDVRVDIPRWPDWTRSLKLLILPGEEAGHAAQPAADQQADLDAASEITFAETASHIWSSREDDEQLETLVAAVTGMTFNLETIIERRLLYAGDEDPHLYPDGYAVWARHTDPPLPLVLYVPHDLADEFEQAGRDPWSCRGTIVGWDHQHRRLQVKVLAQ
ncbi:MAG: hypothetical protein AAFX06_11305 [Planctomycetota bacterium]